MSAAPLYCSLQERLLPEPLNANADNVRAASSNTLTVASDGKVLIKALDGYDGSSPLVVVDKVDAAKGSSVVLLNATAVKEGTTVLRLKMVTRSRTTFSLQTICSSKLWTIRLLPLRQKMFSVQIS